MCLGVLQMIRQYCCKHSVIAYAKVLSAFQDAGKQNSYDFTYPIYVSKWNTKIYKVRCLFSTSPSSLLSLSLTLSLPALALSLSLFIYLFIYFFPPNIYRICSVFGFLRVGVLHAAFACVRFCVRVRARF